MSPAQWPFHVIHFCQFYSTTFLVLFTKTKKLQNERKEDFFAYMVGRFSLSLYIKGGRRSHL